MAERGGSSAGQQVGLEVHRELAGEVHLPVDGGDASDGERAATQLIDAANFVAGIRLSRQRARSRGQAAADLAGQIGERRSVREKLEPEVRPLVRMIGDRQNAAGLIDE